MKKKLCNKYVGDNDATCPQLTCIRDAGHPGDCDNIRGDSDENGKRCCLASGMPPGVHSIDCTMRYMQDQRTAARAAVEAPVVDIFKARIKKQVPDLCALFINYDQAIEAADDADLQASIAHQRVDDLYQGIVAEFNTLILSSMTGSNPAPTIDSVLTWFQLQGCGEPQLTELRTMVQAQLNSRSKKAWHRVLAEAITTGFLALMMGDDDDEDDDVDRDGGGSRGPRAG